MTGLKDATLNCSSKEERREKREERDKHDRDDRVEGGNGSVPEWRYGREKGRLGTGTREPPRVEAVGCEVDSLMHRSKGHVRSAI